ncbi:hypothetical protein M413DRAFT_75940, partial [Hebeloma cylindrosporum]
NSAVKRAKAGEFNPAYSLQSDVDISSIALTGMKQSGLCVMKSSGFEFHPDDTYATVDGKLQIIFPKLFDWLYESEPDDASTSPWLVCLKGPRRDLGLYSDDRLPTGADIIDACRFGKPKVGVSNRILFLVTRYPVPVEKLEQWRPRISAALASSSKGSDFDDQTSDEVNSDASSPTFSPALTTKPSLRRSILRNGSEDEVEQDIISISSMSADEASVPVVKAPTPPCVEAIKDSFFSSINFDDEENPWVPLGSHTTA